MKRISLFIVVSCVMFLGCNPGKDSGESTSAETNVEQSSPANGQTLGGGLSEVNAESAKTSNPTAAPKDVRGYFMALPEKYFLLEGCEPNKDRDCQKAKRDYLGHFLEVDDVENGYLRASGDGGQNSINMAIFKKPDGTYLIAVNVKGEVTNSYKFLNYANGKFEDVSLEVVPEYSTGNIYELPRKGTTVPVYGKHIVEQGADWEVTEKGEKLYDLVWNNGEFSINR
ncbi:MAG: hypothetical protein ACK5NT_02800 [Pyrinomonadaceae bacterium]